MKIEDHWIDKVIYNVTFVVEVYRGPNEIEHKKLNRTLIMPYEITLQEVTKLTLTRFKNAIEVIEIDEVMDCLLLKEIV
ncbi:MAG: hypothetical protein RR470_10065 [Vagococcus sp.]|uniref:hypothetical protein n=1 Tax=Vagococcus sp. TaxID=1933889 RepID=UPI002FC8D16B